VRLIKDKFWNKIKKYKYYNPKKVEVILFSRKLKEIKSEMQKRQLAKGLGNI